MNLYQTVNVMTRLTKKDRKTLKELIDERLERSDEIDKFADEIEIIREKL